MIFNLLKLSSNNIFFRRKNYNETIEKKYNYLYHIISYSILDSISENLFILSIISIFIYNSFYEILKRLMKTKTK